MQVNSVAGILIASVFPYDSKSLVVVSFTESCALLDLSLPPPSKNVPINDRIFSSRIQFGQSLGEFPPSSCSLPWPCRIQLIVDGDPLKLGFASFLVQDKLIAHLSNSQQFRPSSTAAPRQFRQNIGIAFF